MEAGYNSHTNCHRASESQFVGEGIFGEGGSFVVSPSAYYYNSPPACSIKGREAAPGVVRNIPATRHQQQHHCLPPEASGEEVLARKLTLLTDSLWQGKPIRVDDLMSLRLDNESDPKAVQLLANLHGELRHAAANSHQSGQLDPHLPVVNPPPSEITSDQRGSFDAHAVYAGDDAVSSGRWSQIATIGIRTALSALMSRYGLETCNPNPAVSQAPGAQERTRALIKAYNVLESVALTLLSEREKNRESSPKRNRSPPSLSSSRPKIVDDFDDVMFVDLTSQIDLDQAQPRDDNFSSSIFQIHEKKDYPKSSKTTISEMSKNQDKSRTGKQTDGNEENNRSLVNAEVKKIAGGSESRSYFKASRPSAKLSLTKSSYKFENRKTPTGRASRQTTLILQPIAAKVDIGCSERNQMPSVSRHRDNLFDVDYRTKKTSSSFSEDEREKSQDRGDFCSKILESERTIPDERLECDGMDENVIMETPSQIDDSVRSLFEDEDRDDFEASQDLLNTCLEESAPRETTPEIRNIVVERRGNFSNIKDSSPGPESIDETFFAPGELRRITPENNAVPKPVEIISAIAGCSTLLRSTNCEEKNASKRKPEPRTAAEDQLDFNLEDADWDTDMSNDHWPPPKKPLNNSFDIVPGKPKKRSRSPDFAYKEKTERCKEKRNKLPGWGCRDCENYYALLDLPPDLLKKRMNACSRHRSKHNPRTRQTPDGFWNHEFPESLDSSD